MLSIPNFRRQGKAAEGEEIHLKILIDPQLGFVVKFGEERGVGHYEENFHACLGYIHNHGANRM